MLREQQGIGKRRKRRRIDEYPVEIGRELRHQTNQRSRLQKFRGIPSRPSGLQHEPLQRLDAPNGRERFQAILKTLRQAWSGGNTQVAHEIGAIQVCLDQQRSEEHTSELQSRLHLVCRLLLEKKKK